MDRRDALKKLGMGGATVIGASAVMSSPAFANPGTNDCAALTGVPAVSPAQDSGNGGNGGAVVTITYNGLGTISCPCNAGSTTLNAGPQTWTLGGAAPTSTTTTSATWSDLSNGSPGYSFQIRIRCLDQANLAVCSIYTVTGTITVNGNKNSFLPGSATATAAYDPNACP